MKHIMYKKAIESHLVIFIIILASFVVLLFLYKGLTSRFSQLTHDQQCLTSALANAYTKIGGKEVLKLDCPTHYKTITSDDLDPDLAKNKWDNVIKITERSGKRAVFTTPYNKQGFYEYALNELVANEMKSCWKRLGEGKLPLFDEWLSANTKTDSKAICVICARIEFDPSIRNTFGKSNINSLSEWLANNPSELYRVGEPTRVLSYYEFIQDPDTYDPNIAPVYDYSLDRPVAVVFSRTNRHAFSAWLEDLTTDGLIYAKEGVIAAKNFALKKEAELTEEESKAKASSQEFTPKTDVRGWDMLLLIPYDKVGEYCGYLGN